MLRSVRACSFPPPLGANPYQHLLHEALARRGVEVVGRRVLTPWWVWRARGQVDVVHLHWLELIAFEPRRGPANIRNYARGVLMLLALLALGRSEIGVVWTVHNARPHEPRHPRLFRLIERGAARVADVVLVHSNYAAACVRETIRPRGRVDVVYHGPYEGWYRPDERSRAEMRDDIGVPRDATVYLLFGLVRRYKRIPHALRAFAELRDEHARLVVAGMVTEDDLREEIERLAAQDPRVVLHLRWISDDEVTTFHGAADVVVMNYREIFSSGVLLLAWTFGLPAVAPAGGTLEEVARPGAVETFRDGELAAALARVREGSPEDRRQAALAAGRANSWDAMADVVAGAYRDAREGRLRTRGGA